MQAAVLDAAIRTFLLPRLARVRLSRWTAHAVRVPFSLLASPRRSYRTRDRVNSLYPSFVLLAYQAMWLALSLVAFALIYVAAGAPTWSSAFSVSGSSLFTLGTASSHGAPAALTFTEAGVGLTLLALLIAFIPTLYQAFQRREYAVSRLTVRAGVPATPWGILEIAHSVKSNERLEELWREWEQWFIDVGETHTTLVILNHYRSPDPRQTWVASAAAVLDAAALYNACVDVTPSPNAGLCIRAGWLTLRKIADYFGVDYPTTFDEHTPCSIPREEFDVVWDRLQRAGVGLVADRDAGWRDFRGWRVNYDAMIERLCDLLISPRADWRSAALAPLVEPSNERSS